MTPLSRLVFVVVTLLLSRISAEAATSYRITDLGVPPDRQYTIPLSISDARHVVGYTDVGSFLWTPAAGMQSMPRQPVHNGDMAAARGVNNAGQVVGTGGDQRAFVWSQTGGYRDLGDFPGRPGEQTSAYAINNAGQIVGQAGSDGFIWTSSSGMQSLGDLPGGLQSSSALGINAAGEVVGGSNTTGGAHAFLWTASAGMQDLGELPGGAEGSQAADINNRGQVVGLSEGSNGQRAFLWTASGGMQDLGTLPGGEPYFSYATAINDAGQVVGRSLNSAPRDRAFVWTAQEGMLDLNELIDPLDPLKGRASLEIAFDINTAGEIVVVGTVDSRFTRALLLTPVPEPRMSILLLAGLSLVALVWRRRSVHRKPAPTIFRRTERSSRSNRPVKRRRRPFHAHVLRYLLPAALWSTSVDVLAIDWTVTDVGVLPGDGISQASSINNSGQVVGLSGFAGSFIYQNARLIPLGSLQGEDTRGRYINDAGIVVGESSKPGDPARAVRYQNGKWSDLGIGPRSFASGINNQGQIVGSIITAAGEYHAFLSQNGAVTDLGTLGGSFSSAAAINNAGQIVGESMTASGQLHAFLYENATMIDLGTLPGGLGSAASSINDAGQIVGRALGADNLFNPFLYENGQMTDLDLSTFDGGAIDINNQGDIITYDDEHLGNPVEFTLYRHGEATILNDLPAVIEGGWTLISIAGINDAGQIAGTGGANGEFRALLFTPVPEPAQWLMLLIGMGLFCLRRSFTPSAQ